MEGGEDPREGEVDDRGSLQETEHMARAVDLSILTGEGKHPRPHVHVVEPIWGSKFWASGSGDESSDDEEFASSTLVDKAIAVGFTIEQIQQAEGELSLSRVSASSEVCAKPNEGSLSSKIVQLWVANRQNKVNAWSGPLPPPRQSPL
jgi:hypothetical protein